jgi:hypothetical protein
LVQLQHRLHSVNTIVHEIEQNIVQKICYFRCRILLDNFSVDGEKKDNILYSRENGTRGTYG